MPPVAGRTLSKDEVSLLRELFALIDSDGSGSIDKAELRDFISTLNGRLTDADFAKIYQRADEDNNGSVDFDEFIFVLDEACKSVPTGELIGMVSQARDSRREAMNRRRAMFEKKDEKTPELKRVMTLSSAEQLRIQGENHAMKQQLEEQERQRKEMEELQQQLLAANAKIQSLTVELAAAKESRAEADLNERAPCRTCEVKDAEIEALRAKHQERSSHASAMETEVHTLRQQVQQLQSANASARSASPQPPAYTAAPPPEDRDVHGRYNCARCAYLTLQKDYYKRKVIELDRARIAATVANSPHRTESDSRTKAEAEHLAAVLRQQNAALKAENTELKEKLRNTRTPTRGTRSPSPYLSSEKLAPYDQPDLVSRVAGRAASPAPSSELYRSPRSATVRSGTSSPMRTPQRPTMAYTSSPLVSTARPASTHKLTTPAFDLATQQPPLPQTYRPPQYQTAPRDFRVLPAAPNSARLSPPPFVK
eukprot:TRINITY_DN17435_c0_g1_i2.p1 TRINITY_DN17435_c0_g1~~TRINITY_DN17435_c0_g1_i2.p1  ORF type:complete len:482 (-),score=83.41 TRINITY_DN17435_c0_g1_i2:1239-2684(-)